MQTKYEEQAIDLLGEVPCQTVFFKVKDYLIGYINVEKVFAYDFVGIMSNMLSTKFLENITFSNPLFFYTRD